MYKKLLATTKGKKFDTPPIWLMRQAGRYLPEYREVRQKAGSFLNLCYNPELASEVTLQPIKRFDFDGAVIFSDILVIPDAYGVELNYIEGKGPVLQRLESEDELNNFNLDITSKLTPVYDAIRMTKANLSEEKTLIGFTGAPWTIAYYMLEGEGKTSGIISKTHAFNMSNLLKKLINILTESVFQHLAAQIEAGADIVQIFDSWAGFVPETEFDWLVLEPAKYIASKIKKYYPETGIIYFPKGANDKYHYFAASDSIDVVSLDQFVSIEQANKLSEECIIQGNLDPIALFSEYDKLKSQVERIKSNFTNKTYIFNLGHGVLPSTPIENVEQLVKLVRDK